MQKILYHVSRATSPAYNLAMEEFLLRNRREGTIFLLWQNAPSVIIGRNQVAASEVNLAFARARGIPVLRRLTGGGAVYHDLGNINFTFIKDYDPENPPRLSSLISPIADFLRQMNLPAFTGSRNDLLVDRKKVCGTAFAIDRCRKHSEGNVGSPDPPLPSDFMQTIASGSDQLTFLEGKPSVSVLNTDTKSEPSVSSKPCSPRILVHGCLLFNVDLDILSRILTPAPEKLARYGIPSVQSRVANLMDLLPDETVETFKKKLIDSVLSENLPQKLRLTQEEVKSVFALAKNYKNLTGQQML